MTDYLEPDEITAIIQRALPGADVHVEDLRGTRDHYQAIVIDAAFAGHPLIVQHRMVLDPLREHLREQVHALTIQTYTPEQWAARRG